MYENLYLHVVYLVIVTFVQKLQVIWQPYDTDEVETMALNAICKCDQELWRLNSR
jgi:hypothetical protein